MFIKKAGGQIFGAELTSAEKKALDIEIKKSLGEYTDKHEIEMAAIPLYILHTHFGFGEKRLKEMFGLMVSEIDALTKRYEDPNDNAWICTKRLLEKGFDISKWYEGTD